MSWNVLAAQPGSTIEAAVTRQLGSARTYSDPIKGDVIAPLMGGIEGLVREMAGRFPDRTIIVESQGHVDRVNGRLALTITVLQP